MAYTTAADLKVYLDISSGTTTDDALLTALIARAQAVIDVYCMRTFEASADTDRTFDALEDVAGRVLYLDRDLCAITTITNGDGTVLASSDYVTEPRNDTPYYAIRLKASSAHDWTYNDDAEDAIEVTGKWAYSTSAPASIVQACTRLAAWFYRQRDNANDLDRAIALPGATLLPSRIPADVQTMLAPYVRGVG